MNDYAIRLPAKADYAHTVGHKGKCRKCDTCIDAEPKGRRGYGDVVENQYSEAFDFLPQMP
ncbi:MAG TPA: hypothetical protein VE566_02935 [Nitrososphaeraceae archaeon]|nr:hypothetical protein [Nitrososphaeraceae archaeon]